MGRLVSEMAKIELDEGALLVADMAYMETTGTSADKVRAAIKTYLWASATEGFTLPSLNEVREFLSQ